MLLATMVTGATAADVTVTEATGAMGMVAGTMATAVTGMVVTTGTATVAALKRTSLCVATRQDFLPRSF